MFYVALMCCYLYSYSLLLCAVAHSYRIFDPALLFDTESLLCPLHSPKVCWSGSETPCIIKVGFWTKFYPEENCFEGVGAHYILYNTEKSTIHDDQFSITHNKASRCTYLISKGYFIEV